MSHVLAVGAMVPHRLWGMGATRTTRNTLHRVSEGAEDRGTVTIQTVVLCDECEAVFAPDQPQPRGGLSQSAHDAGWTSTNTRGRWTNQCPDHNH